MARLAARRLRQRPHLIAATGRRGKHSAEAEARRHTVFEIKNLDKAETEARTDYHESSDGGGGRHLAAADAHAAAADVADDGSRPTGRGQGPAVGRPRSPLRNPVGSGRRPARGSGRSEASGPTAAEVRS